ncbi:TlpA disulfide reductase family protein [Thalassotalea algicola]|uniref:TlpA disulfide reductase family protein n=1 Tax=Thalassotalea algicola TaxID=2716224 RepID=UPI002E28FB52|nr:TlpA disulfide reductase family protein [Thalassotalea algicola]
MWLVCLIFGLSTVTFADERKQKVAELTQFITKQQGKVVYVDFWASWCIPCRQSFPWLNNMVEKYQDRGLQVVSVNLDADKDNATQFLAEFPASFPVIYDAKGYIARKFKLPGMPSSMLFDRQGQLIATHVGFNSEKQQKFQQEITLLLED